MCTVRTYELKALSAIWTGSVCLEEQGGGLRERIVPDRLITTGLLGSIRWWFEVVVRGLGGSACDPTVDGNRCPDTRKEPHGSGHHCVVCELFGCTGWARKFRFDVLDPNGGTIKQRINKDTTLRFRFTPLRPVCPEEWALLDLTLRFIADYGAIGGKTVLKPSDEPGLADLDLADFEEVNGSVRVRSARGGLPLRPRDIVTRVGSHGVASLDHLRQAVSDKEHGEPVSVAIIRNGQARTVDAWFGKRHHLEYGLLRIVRIVEPQRLRLLPEQVLRNYVNASSSRWRQVGHEDFIWASLRNFWYVGRRYLARQSAYQSTFNRIIGRPEPKNQAQHGDSWCAGRRPRQNVEAESKKVFSFKDPVTARRTFGFVQAQDNLDEMKQRLREKAWKDLKDLEFVAGAEVLKRLLGQGGAA